MWMRLGDSLAANWGWIALPGVAAGVLTQLRPAAAVAIIFQFGGYALAAGQARPASALIHCASRGAAAAVGGLHVRRCGRHSDVPQRRLQVSRTIGFDAIAVNAIAWQRSATPLLPICA